MATNAPYYQMRTGQLIANINSDAVAQAEESQDVDYALSPTIPIELPIENQHLPFYPERAARRPGVDIQPNIIEENHNLVDLLEAATTAADQDFVPKNPDETVLAHSDPERKIKRKRNPSLPADMPNTSEDLSQDHESSFTKRRRIGASPTDPSLRINNNDTAMHSPTSSTSPSPSRDSLLTDARAAGVHSAAALFRRTSSLTTRKYTRPPMSKLFMSLNITPENFIALQALAKAYMLSPAHPDRQSCVGNRGKGDTDMVKLRLFNCVRDFLADDGVGEQFFGAHVEQPGAKESKEAAAALGEKQGGGEKLVWPRDGNKIIGLVTPLMRRMVTNERQRLYAIDTRKGGKKSEKEDSVEAPNAQFSPGPPVHDVEQNPQKALDPTLQPPATSQRSSPPAPTTTIVQTHSPKASALPTSNPMVLSSPTAPYATFPTDAAEPHLTHINIFLTYILGASKSIKLDEKRISTTRPAHLTFYNYNAFLEQVKSMASRAELLHSSIKAFNPISATTEVGESKSESLRGLAAAANALQPDKDDQQPQTATTLTSSPTSPSAFCSSPRYIVKTIGPTGWQVIDSAEIWYHVLTERAFAMWADGVCNIIVELNSAQLRSVVRNAGDASGEASGDVEMEGS